MSYSTPKIKQVVQKTPDPLINLGDTAADVKNQRNKRGLLSTFMGNSMPNNRTAGFLSGMMQKQPSLGNSNL